MDEAAITPVAAKRSREHWIVLGLALLAPLGLLAMGRFLTPSPNGHGTHEQLGLPPCTLMQRFGIPCPGCGVTTAVVLAGRGELAQSFWTQPLGFALALAALLALPLGLIAHFAGRDAWTLLQKLSQRPLWYALVALVVAAWIYKLVVTLA